MILEIDGEIDYYGGLENDHISESEHDTNSDQKYDIEIVE